MSMSALWPVSRAFVLAQFAEQRARLVLMVLALAVGVALIAMVYLVNATAVEEFDAASRQLSGQADLIVRGPKTGFAEALYVSVSHSPAVAAASPVLEVEVALADGHTLSVLGLDAFRVGAVEPSLGFALAPDLLALLDAHSIVLSAAAAADLGLSRGGTLNVRVGAAPVALTVLDVLPEAALGAPLGVMDLGAAQWTLGALGTLNRIDLRLAPGVGVAAARTALADLVPPGTLLTTPTAERDRASSMSLAYRANLNMLALVALLTGAFLVYATQSLAVQRRRAALGLLRALGVRRGELLWALLLEAALLGLAGGLLGVAGGWLAAALLLKRFGADLGGGYFRGALALAPHPLALAGFVLLGVLVAALGACLPARSAVRAPIAQALKSAGATPAAASRPRRLALLGLGAALVALVALSFGARPGLPLGGYVGIAAALGAGLCLVPFITRQLLKVLPERGPVAWRLALAQLSANAARADVSLAALIVSFSLMVAMSIMVHSFRDSFGHWLDRVLPADLNVRVPLGATSAYWDGPMQTRVAKLPGVSRVEFRRTESLLFAADRPAVTLIARPVDRARPGDTLPMLTTVPVGAAEEVVYGSEAMQDLYGWRPGAEVELPLAGRRVRARVGGIWRDYARSFGAIVIDRARYRALTGRNDATEAGLWLSPGADAAQLEAGLRRLLGAGGSYEVLSTPALKARSLELFDRAFAVTYLLEAIAVVLGLLGVGFAFGAQALARQAEFGMLRHLGLRRRDIALTLALEGAVMGLGAVLYGLAIGAGLSLILVYVIDRQSFHWSLDLYWPFGELALASLVLIAAAAVTAALGARAAMGSRAVAAVREDW